MTIVQAICIEKHIANTERNYKLCWLLPSTYLVFWNFWVQCSSKTKQTALFLYDIVTASFGTAWLRQGGEALEKYTESEWQEGNDHMHLSSEKSILVCQPFVSIGSHLRYTSKLSIDYASQSWSSREMMGAPCWHAKDESLHHWHWWVDRNKQIQQNLVRPCRNEYL